MQFNYREVMESEINAILQIAKNQGRYHPSIEQDFSGDPYCRYSLTEEERNQIHEMIMMMPKFAELEREFWDIADR